MEASDLELTSRYQDVFQQYITKASNVAKVLEDFGRTRKELAALLQEIKTRNLKVEMPDAQKPSR